MAVHLYGHPADMAALQDIAESKGILLVEDCAQAHGAMIGTRRVGSIGSCGAFSFYPTKNLGAFGDGGAITTSDAGIAHKIRLLQQYGWSERYVSTGIGYNSRLDELQAAILERKLAWLDSDNDRRRHIAELYSEGLKGLPLETPGEFPGNRHVYHQYVIRLHTERTSSDSIFWGRKIQTTVLYPKPIHLQAGYQIV